MNKLLTLNTVLLIANVILFVVQIIMFLVLKDEGYPIWPAGLQFGLVLIFLSLVMKLKEKIKNG